MSNTRNRDAKQRLHSWKAIATFFECDERTVRRWEIERRLPVHRVPGSARGAVYAFTDELEGWLRQPQAAQSDLNDSGEEQGSSSKCGAMPMKEIAKTTIKIQSRSGIVAWALATVLLTAVAALIIRQQTTRFGARAAEPRPRLQPYVANSEVRDLYLKGRFAWNKRTPESLNQAVDYFTQAVVRDPAYAEPYIGLADCYNLLREFSTMPPSEAYPRAVAAARKAVELAPESSDA